MPTIGVDFGVTKINYNDRLLKINLFDLSGNGAFAEVRNEFYKDTQAALFVYDVTCRESFGSLQSWLNELKTYIPESSDWEKIVFILCANKVDKPNRVIGTKLGEEWARTNGFCYVETSAQSGEGVNNVFHVMFKALFAVIENGKRPKSTNKGSADFTKEQMDAINQLKNARDNYSCLGLSYGASKDDVTRSYKKLAKLLHPDKCDSEESSDAFKKLTAAKDELLKVTR